MLRFTYASAHPSVPRTSATVVVCVVALHALAIAALLLSPSTTDIDNQHSIAMELVLAPVNNTPAKAQQQSGATPTAAPPSAATKDEQTMPSSAPASQKAPATPAATPAQTGQAGQTKGAPAFSLPSSEAHGLNNPKPAYPRMSRRLNEQGQVVIRVFVGADGSPQQGEITTSSGFDRLDQEALRTVMRWRFVPGQRLGTPEAMWFNVPVNFVLE
jgi:protein TonB